MVIRKKKKVRKKRGERSYGYGSHKKHRGGGSRGGRGKAGMHKHKWSYTVKYEPDHFGKHGFSRAFAKGKPKTINLKNLEIIAKKTGKKDIDLAELGYDKVLGTGKLSGALNIKAKLFSKKAVEKIEATGGKAIKTEVKKESNKE
jgi:large subunit ribosomal protein L15